jgi:hypothetical protein
MISDRSARSLDSPSPPANVNVIAIGCAARARMSPSGQTRLDRADGRSCHVRCAAHCAAARSSLSTTRATIIKSVSGDGLCSAFASSHGARMRQPGLGIRKFLMYSAASCSVTSGFLLGKLIGSEGRKNYAATRNMAEIRR